LSLQRVNEIDLAQENQNCGIMFVRYPQFFVCIQQYVRYWQKVWKKTASLHYFVIKRYAVSIFLIAKSLLIVEIDCYKIFQETNIIVCRKTNGMMEVT